MKLSIKVGKRMSNAFDFAGNAGWRTGTMACLAFMAAATAHGFQNWTGKAGNWVFNDPANWVKSPVYLDLDSTTGSGEVGGVQFDAHLSLQGMTGVYTFTANLLSSRIVACQPNKDIVLDLQGHTFTLLGKETAEAFYFRGDAPGSTVTFTNGTVLVPESPYEGHALAANYVNVAHNQNGLPTNVTLRIAGAGTILKSPRTDLKYGAHNCISVENGATLETTLNLGGAIDKSNTVSEHLTLRLDAGTFKTTDGTKVFTVGGVANSVSNELVLANGGRLENMDMHMFTIGKVAGARYSRVILEGRATSISITNRPAFPVSYSAAGSGYWVRKGASLTFTNTDGNDSLGRFWLTQGGEIVVTGEGSRLISESSLPCNVGNAASDAQVIISDGATACCGALTAGSSINCNDNVIRVDTGASLAVTTCNIGGQMNDDSGQFAMSNRLEVLSGGTVVATNCYVGSRSYSKDNWLCVSGAGSSMTVLSTLDVGVTRGVGNQVEVGGGASVSVLGKFAVKGAGSAIRLLGGRLTVAEASFAAPVQMTFACPADASIPSFKVTGGGLSIPATASMSIDPNTRLPDLSDKKWTLLSCSGNLTVPDTVMDNLQATVPAGFRLQKTADELSVVRIKGTVLILK